jgi:hypothetical protein
LAYLIETGGRAGFVDLSDEFYSAFFRLLLTQ